MNKTDTDASIYLLAYFRQIYAGRVETGADGSAYVVALTEEILCAEFLHLAFSHEGLRWTPLNGNRATLDRPENTAVIRDPFVGRGPDGWFHLVATGGRQRGDIWYARSRDLIAWEDQRAVSLVNDMEQAHNAWAPEWVWDEAQQNYFVFWSTSFGQHGWDDSRIWCARTQDFHTFTYRRVLFDPGYTVIDATLLYHDTVWHMVFKDERFGHAHGEHRFLKMATAPNLDGPYTVVTDNITPSITEGPAILRLNDPPHWAVMYDWCMANDYGVSVSDDLLHWRELPRTEIRFPPNARHGSVVKITPAELDALTARFGTE